MTPLKNQQKQLLFDYCTGLTSEEQSDEARQLISSNPEAAEIHSKLKAVFAPLDSLEPEICPDELVEGTVWRLNNAARSSQLRLQQLLATEQARKVATKGRYWRDLAKRVATAAVFMVVGGTLIGSYNAGTYFARQKSLDHRCQMQLSSQIGRGIDNYKADHNGQMPTVATAAGSPWWKVGDRSKENNSNTRHMWLLVKQGYVKPSEFICPGSIQRKMRGFSIPYIKQLNDFPARRYVTYSMRISCRKSPTTKVVSRRAIIADLNPLFEILPHDYGNPLNLKPNKDLLEANSINHKRRGQNILFCDGSAKFVKKRIIGIIKDDIFTLQDTQVYKGHELPSCETDAFLAP
ncbi:MAG: hypothetical protein ACYS1A_14375 [Planctomycetota bacterium]|jgi:hypothetical protein